MIDKIVDIYDTWSKGGRARDLRQLSHECDFRYERRVDFGNQPSDIKGFKIFSKKGIKRLMGVMETDLERNQGTIRFYDFIRTRDLETYTQSIVEVYCEDIFTPCFMIEPKGVLNRSKRIFSRNKKLYPEAKQFHKQFYIQTEAKGVKDILNAKVLNLLLEYPKLKLEAKGHCFVFYLKKNELPLDQIMPLFDFAEDVVFLLGAGGEEAYV